MKNAKIQTPEIVAYEVRYRDRQTNQIFRFQFSSEEQSLEYRDNLHRSANPPVWSEVYRLRTKTT